MSEPSILKITELIQDIQKEYLKIEEDPGSNDTSMIIIDENIDRKIDEICSIIRTDKNMDTDTDKDSFIKKYIKEIFSINIAFNNKDSFEEEYNFVDIDAYADNIKLSPNEKKFLFFMNYNLVSRNLIPRIKPLFKLIDALDVLEIKSDLKDPKIIALYAYDNIFPIETLRLISSLIKDKDSFPDKSDIDNYQQLKYIFGILKSSEQFNNYNRGGGPGEKHEHDADGENKVAKRTKLLDNAYYENEAKKKELLFIHMKKIYDFINNLIEKIDKKYDLYNLDCDSYFINEHYKNEYEISLHQFNMLISNDSKYIENMFGILFIELKNNDDITIISEIYNIFVFAKYLFTKEYFYKKINYMHKKVPAEEYTKIDNSTKEKISIGLDKLINESSDGSYGSDGSDGSKTFQNFKDYLLKYLKDEIISENISENISIRGNIKHSIDTLMKIYYEAYILGKKCDKKKQLITQGGKKYNYKNTGIKKIFNKKERCIYKMQGSNKEYIRHKNELISFKDFKTINNKPVKTDNKPVKTDKKSLKTDKKSLKTYKKSVKTEKKTVKTDKKSVKTEKKSVKTDKKPVKIDKKPVKTDKKPVKTDKKPVKTDKKPVKTDKKPVKTDKKPVKTEKKSVKKNIFFNLF